MGILSTGCWVKRSMIVFRNCNPAVLCSKANKEARLMERVCFISVTGNWGWGLEEVGTGKVDSCPKVNSPHWSWVGKSYHRWRKGATCRKSTVSSDSRFEIGHRWSDQSSWLFEVQLIFSSRISLFPFLWGQFLELWQFVSWLQSGHHIVNFSTWWGFQ